MDRDEDGIDDREELKHEIVHDGWINRRRIAWTSFIYCLLYPVFLFLTWMIDKELSALLVNVSAAVFTLCGANLTWYFTMSSWEKIKEK